MEKLIFWGKIVGSIFLIYKVLLVVAEIFDDGWEKFVAKYKRKLNGSEINEAIQTAKKKAIEDEKRSIQRNIEDADGWENFIEPLKIEYEKEKAELSIQKKIKCDDGVIRIYKEDMRGVISESMGEDLSIFIYKSRAPHNIYLVISHIKCFSKDGKTLNCDEIISNYKHKRQLDDKFFKKYKEIIPRTYITSSPRKRLAKEYSNLDCINGIFFYSDKTPFSGEILFKKNSDCTIIKDGYILNSKSEKKSLNEIKLDFFTFKDIDNAQAVQSNFNECFFSEYPHNILFQYKISNFYNYFDKIQDGLE